MSFAERRGAYWIWLAVWSLAWMGTAALAAPEAIVEPEEGPPAESAPPSATSDDEGGSPPSDPPAENATDEPHPAAPSDSPNDAPNDAPSEPAGEQPDEDKAATEGEESSAAPAAMPQDRESTEPGKIAPDSQADANRPALQPAAFREARPGETSRESLHEEWGPPAHVEKFAGGFRETYEVAPFGKARLTIVDDTVDSIAVHLEKNLALKVVEKNLQIEDVEPVEVFDEQGHLVGRSYPERGVLLGFAQTSTIPRVSQIVIQAIDAQPFLDRASRRLETNFAGCMEDLQQAFELAPDAAQAQWLHAELTLRAGELEQARASAEKIVEREPAELEYRLTLAKVLAASGDYSQAIEHASAVAGSGEASATTQARAQCLWGDYLAAWEKHDYKQAMQHHLKAIALAEPLAASTKLAERRAAKQVLVDANLAVAGDIGWGRWQQKSKIVPKWIDRAAAFADHLFANEHVSRDVQLCVHEKALAALAGIADPPDAGRHVRGLVVLGRKMMEEAADSSYKAHLAWRLGVALNDAVEVEATRKQLDSALALGDLALDYLEQGAEASKQLPARDYVRGRLCYRLGAVFAVQKSDHQRAVAWFDRAVPLLESPVPPAAINCGKQGETFVSIAVSYWAVNRRDEAVRLTNQGLKLMEQAVEEGLLDKSALAIPYGNLSSMHQELGDAQEAKKYAELAVRHDEAAKK